MPVGGVLIKEFPGIPIVVDNSMFIALPDICLT
jgi:hypothetical protein